MNSLTRFEQVMQLMPWHVFDEAVRRHGSDRYTKGFSTRCQFKAMAYAQFTRAESLRDVQDGYAQHKRIRHHIGLPAICRSTLSDANSKRSVQPFAETADALMRRLGHRARGQHGHMLRLLDSTTIRLVGRGFEWTSSNATRDRGLKVHVLYRYDEDAPMYQSITPANVNDVCEGRKLQLEQGATYVFDKAYCDYAWWQKICEAGSRFVTRAKSNIALKVVRERRVPAEDRNVILEDYVAKFRNASNRGGHRNAYSGLIRSILLVRDTGEILQLLTNDLKSSAREIADLYKRRWQIELFFKWIKQNLQVEQFLGRSENAVRIQLLVALITYLLLLLYGSMYMPRASLKSVLTVMRHGLMTRPQNEESAYVRHRRHQRYIASVQRPLFT